MKTCPNCGKTLEENEIICSNCGVNTVEESTESTQLESLEQNTPNAPYKPKRFVSKINYGPQLFKDDDQFYLLDVYISKNVNKMKNGFSWPAFFFSSLYFFYRKMWLLGVATIIFFSILGFFIKDPLIFFLVSLIYDIIVASKFKDMYLKKALEEVDRVKAENPNKTDEELAEIVKNRGGTSTVVLIIIFVGLIITFVVNGVIIITTIQKTSKEAEEYLKETLDKSKDSADKINDLIREKKEINVAGNLYIILPSGYEKVTNIENEDAVMVFTNNLDCKIAIKTVPAENYLNSTDAYMNEKIKLLTNETGIELKNASYHSHPWKYATINKPTKAMIFASVKDGTIYDVTVTNQKESTTCMLNAEQTALTFKFK